MGLVSAEWLLARANDAEVRLCDVRWYLPTTGRQGRAEYAAGHLPGAVFVELDTALAEHDDGTQGRHPLPAPERFVEAMRTAGISSHTHVVAYDDAGGAFAARLWWLLRLYGHTKVSLLDGGIEAWKQAGGTLTDASPAVPLGNFSGTPDGRLVADRDTTRQAVRAGALLLDARAAPRYRGDTEPVDPRAGHVPGAVNLPFSDLLDGGRFLAVDRLRQRLAATGLSSSRPVISSCGSGVTGCHLLFALEHAGLRPLSETRLYAGSYSDWSRRSELPVATGDAPGNPS